MKLDFNNMGFSLPESNMRSGIGSTIGIGGNYYRHSRSGYSPSDGAALQSDWEVIGRDISDSMSSQPFGNFGMGSGKNTDRKP